MNYLIFKKKSINNFKISRFKLYKIYLLFFLKTFYWKNWLKKLNCIDLLKFTCVFKTYLKIRVFIFIFNLVVLKVKLKLLYLLFFFEYFKKKDLKLTKKLFLVITFLCVLNLINIFIERIFIKKIIIWYYNFLVNFRFFFFLKYLFFKRYFHLQFVYLLKKGFFFRSKYYLNYLRLLRKRFFNNKKFLKYIYFRFKHRRFLKQRKLLKFFLIYKKMNTNDFLQNYIIFLKDRLVFTKKFNFNKLIKFNRQKKVNVLDKNINEFKRSFYNKYNYYNNDFDFSNLKLDNFNNDFSYYDLEKVIKRYPTFDFYSKVKIGLISRSNLNNVYSRKLKWLLKKRGISLSWVFLNKKIPHHKINKRKKARRI